jgi:Regulator of chromosome condensation (RCC1) repeat
VLSVHSLSLLLLASPALLAGCGARTELGIGGDATPSSGEVVALALGWSHGCALLRTGAAACWGSVRCSRLRPCRG